MPTPTELYTLKFRNAEENDLWREVYKLTAAFECFAEESNAPGIAADDAVLLYRDRLPSPSDQRDELERKVAEENAGVLSEQMTFLAAWCVAQERKGYDSASADAWAAAYSANSGHLHIERHFVDWLAVVMQPVADAAEEDEKPTVSILDYVDQVLADFKTMLDTVHNEAEKTAPTLRSPRASGDEARASNDPVSFTYAFGLAQAAQGYDVKDWNAYRWLEQGRYPNDERPYSRWAEAVAAFAASRLGEDEPDAKPPTLLSTLARLGAPNFDTVKTEQGAADLIVREFQSLEAEIETLKHQRETKALAGADGATVSLDSSKAEIFEAYLTELHMTSWFAMQAADVRRYVACLEQDVRDLTRLVREATA